MKWQRIIVAITILIIIVASIYFFEHYDWRNSLTLHALKRNALHWRNYVANNYLKSVVLYILIYIGISMLPLPGDTLFNIAGGYLFGAIPATLYINFSMTVAALIMFLIVRYLGKNLFKESQMRPILWVRRQIQSHGHNYFLMIRLIPLIPISFVNIAAGLTRIPVQTFIWTTSLGLLPISFILAYSGQELRTIKHINDIFSVHIIAILVILGFITLSPIFFNLMFRKKFRSAKN